MENPSTTEIIKNLLSRPDANTPVEADKILSNLSEQERAELAKKVLNEILG